MTLQDLSKVHEIVEKHFKKESATISKGVDEALCYEIVRVYVRGSHEAMSSCLRELYRAFPAEVFEFELVQPWQQRRPL